MQFLCRKKLKLDQYNTDSPLILYNAECKSGGVQKLSGAVFCKQIRRSAETEQNGFLHQIRRSAKIKRSGFLQSTNSEKNDDIVSNQWGIGITHAL